MALPKLNEAPRYQLTIPSTNKTITYRPYLVKEEKVLLIAFESQDANQMLRAIVDTIEACVYDELDMSKLATFDIEYMFLQIRTRSVGETAKVNAKCSHEGCGARIPIEINLNDIKVKSTKEVSKKLRLTDEITLVMRYPTYNDVMANATLTNEKSSQSEQTFELIRMSMEAIETEDERILLKEESREEIDNFIESMSSSQFAMIQQFIDAMPKLSHEVEFECTSCGTKQKQLLEGMQSFF